MEDPKTEELNNVKTTYTFTLLSLFQDWKYVEISKLRSTVS